MDKNIYLVGAGNGKTVSMNKIKERGINIVVVDKKDEHQFPSIIPYPAPELPLEQLRLIDCKEIKDGRSKRRERRKKQRQVKRNSR